MGRKPSNVYDYFTRLEPQDGRGLVRYECKKCQKQYASNATRLADHLKQSGCSPTFQSNQRATGGSGSGNGSGSGSGGGVPVGPPMAPPAPLPVPTTPGMLAEADLSLESDLLLRLAKLSTCAIADALAQMGIQAHLVDVDLVRGYEAPLAMNICGPALTVKVMPANGPPVKKWPVNYVDSVEMGQVVVISAPERCTSAVFGGLMATAAKARSAAGVVTDGRVRDVQEFSAMNFPVFSRGTSVHGQRNSTAVVTVGDPVVVSGCVVRSNDIIRADINGVVVVPAEHALDVALKAELIEDQDNKIAEAVQLVKAESAAAGPAAAASASASKSSLPNFHELWHDLWQDL